VGEPPGRSRGHPGLDASAERARVLGEAAPHDPRRPPSGRRVPVAAAVGVEQELRGLPDDHQVGVPERLASSLRRSRRRPVVRIVKTTRGTRRRPLSGSTSERHSLVEDLEATFPALTGRVALLPPPPTRDADIARLAAEPADHPWFDDDVPIVTAVGHVHPRKDHRTLVRAMARIRDVGGPRAARLVIIGSASQGGEAAAVRSLVDELGLTQQIAMLGEQSNPLRFVARSTAFALSSRNEGVPVSILEAMAVVAPTSRLR
jgi:glycosyltransferase involved in cell wall biosynthesis